MAKENIAKFFNAAMSDKTLAGKLAAPHSSASIWRMEGTFAMPLFRGFLILVPSNIRLPPQTQERTANNCVVGAASCRPRHAACL